MQRRWSVGGQLVILQACTAAAAPAVAASARDIVTAMTHETNFYTLRSVALSGSSNKSHARKFSLNKINDQ